jgi:hypothetical protein
MDYWAQIQAWAQALSVSDWMAIGSVLVAGVALLISQATAVRQQRVAREGLRLARDSDLIAWADLAIEAIADAQGYCRDLKNNLLIGPEAARAQSGLRTRLSALLDRGRLFFPNQPAPDEDPPPPGESAYVGEPHPAIDALYRVYRIVSDLGRFEMKPAEAVQAVVTQRRRFVSEVFDSIDPRRRASVLKRL